MHLLYVQYLTNIHLTTGETLHHAWALLAGCIVLPNPVASCNLPTESGRERGKEETDATRRALPPIARMVGASASERGAEQFPFGAHRLQSITVGLEVSEYRGGDLVLGTANKGKLVRTFPR